MEKYNKKKIFKVPGQAKLKNMTPTNTDICLIYYQELSVPWRCP